MRRLNKIFLIVQPSFKLLFNVIADSHDLTESRRCFERMRVGSYSVKCTVNIIFKSKNKLLSKSMFNYLTDMQVFKLSNILKVDFLVKTREICQHARIQK